MSFTFPDFTEPVALDGGGRWTATFDSYDQHHDDVYYVLVVRRQGRNYLVGSDHGYDGRRKVQVGLSWAGDDRTGAAFVAGLRKELHLLATRG